MLYTSARQHGFLESNLGGLESNAKTRNGRTWSLAIANRHGRLEARVVVVCPSKAADKKFHRTLNLPGVRLDVGVDDSVRHGAARGVCVGEMCGW